MKFPLYGQFVCTPPLLSLKVIPGVFEQISSKMFLERVDGSSIKSFLLGLAKMITFLIPKFTIASNATLTVFSEERLAKDCCAFLPISLQFVMSLHGAWRIRRVLWSALDFLQVLGTRSSMEAHGNRLWGGTENLKLKILSEMEVAPRYKLLTLLTMLAM